MYRLNYGRLILLEGKAPFSGETQAVIDKLKSVYGCDLAAGDSHMLTDES